MDTVDRAWSQIVAGLARNRRPSVLAGVLRLPVTTLGAHEEPPIFMQQAQDLRHLHGCRLTLRMSAAGTHA
jgi:hypothetical protein